jgi:hypothetical protein
VTLQFFLAAHGGEPVDARELAGQIAKDSRPRTQTLAGYDLTFSPVKSVSTFGAVADPAVAAVIERAHQAAVQDALTCIEQHALFTRTGPQGIRQVNVRGLVATAFTHRDSLGCGSPNEPAPTRPSGRSARSSVFLSADAFHAWVSDRAAGLDAIMLAPTRDLVAELNRRARAHRSTSPDSPLNRLADPASTPARPRGRNWKVPTPPHADSRRRARLQHCRRHGRRP